MTRDDVVNTVRAHRAELSAMGVLHAAVFGSVARGEDRPDSDVDILVEVDPDKVRGIFALGRIQVTMEQIVGRSVDLARRDRLRPAIATEAARDSVDVF